MKIYLPWLSFILLMIISSSCRNDDVAPIRNVRFDPGLLNPIQAAGGAPCAAHRYYDNGEAKALGTVYSGMILVGFDKSQRPEQAVAVAESYGFVERLGQAVQTNSASLYPVRLVGGLSCKQVEMAMAELSKNPAVTYVAPFFQAAGEARLLGVSNEFIITVEDNPAADQVMRRLASATRTAVVTALGEHTYLLRADKNSRGNALEMANFFQEQPHVKHAEPDFVLSPEL